MWHQSPKGRNICSSIVGLACHDARVLSGPLSPSHPLVISHTEHCLPASIVYIPVMPRHAPGSMFFSLGRIPQAAKCTASFCPLFETCFDTACSACSLFKFDPPRPHVLKKKISEIEMKKFLPFLYTFFLYYFYIDKTKDKKASAFFDRLRILQCPLN